MKEIFLSRIAIHDFRTFGDFEVDVPAAPGLVLLTGTNGLGKSSFFDAIEWGLTGKIRRFQPYLQKGRRKLTEKDYLTRRGAGPGAHHVSLTFSDGEPIVRGAASATSMTDIIAQLARPDRRAIKDLGAYLALTHFLGQAAQQRFTSRDSHEQWDALKGPSGIERLEHIRAGLRGRATVSALTRRIESEQGAVTQLERQIADWQGWMGRLERLRSAARATGVLTSAEIAERIDGLEADLKRLAIDPGHVPSGEEVGSRLAGLADHIGETLRSTVDRKSALEAMASLPAQFAVTNGDAQSDHPTLVRLRNDVTGAQERLDRATPLAEAARKVVSAQTAAIASIEQTIATFEAALTDLSRRGQLAELIAAASTEHGALTDAIAGHRATLRAADIAIKQHSDAAAEVARLRSLAGSAKTLNDSVPDYLRLEAESGIAVSALENAETVAETAATELEPLEAQFADLGSQIAIAIQSRAEADRHATAMSAALSKLASHIHQDDTDCPVCRTKFDPGVLKALVDAAASSSDDRLTRADEALEAQRAKEAELNARIVVLRALVAAPIEMQDTATAAGNAASDAKSAIALVLGIPPDGDIVAMAAQRARDSASALNAAEAGLEPLAAGAAAALDQRSSVGADLEDLISRESQLAIRLAQLRAEDVACAERIAARNLSDVLLVDLRRQLTGQRQQLEAAREHLGRLSEVATVAIANTQGEQTAFDMATRALAIAEATRASAEQSARQMQRRWAQAGLADAPSPAAYERGLAAIHATIGTLTSISERQMALARENEDTLLQREINEIVASMHVAGGSEGAGDPPKHLGELNAMLTDARAAVRLTRGARAAVNRYSEELQAQADDFSSRVLDPLNIVIDDFNEAMLSTPGESIQFKADTRIDATSFGMALRYRERVENAIEAQKGLPPQVVLSEGQLAANGFSILCAASTAYPWSHWRALLLDDPLQHNDIIHTAAFIDVMRNMVELNGYQLIMSSHDRGESDFIARKFDAAGLPCSTILLTAPSDKGVVWASPENNQAAERFLRRNAPSSAGRA